MNPTARAVSLISETDARSGPYEVSPQDRDHSFGSASVAWIGGLGGGS